jgi:hypothetical protein
MDAGDTQTKPKARRRAVDAARAEPTLRADAAWQRTYSETFARAYDDTLTELIARDGSGEASRSPHNGARRVSVPERCTIEKAELILGLKRRNIQAMAARGVIPGAAKFCHLWTFDIAQLRRYIRERQQKCNGKRQQDVFGVATSFGVASISTGARSGDRFRQATRKLRLSGGRQRKSE